MIAPDKGSTSANTGLAPNRTALEAVAIKVRGVVINSSPGPRPKARLGSDNEPLETKENVYISRIN